MRRLTIVTTFSGSGRTIVNLAEKIASGELDAAIPFALTDRECSGIARVEACGIEVRRVPWTKGTTPEDWAARAWPAIEAAGADLVCNCGFLRLLLLPPAWEGKVMNIHPALLPAYGGKGMWGDHVHRAVLAAGDPESGCTVHFVTNEYDAGPVILQKRVPVLADDTVESLAARVFARECEAYPEAIRLFGEGRLRVENGKVIAR